MFLNYSSARWLSNRRDAGILKTFIPSLQVLLNLRDVDPPLITEIEPLFNSRFQVFYWSTCSTKME